MAEARVATVEAELRQSQAHVLELSESIDKLRADSDGGLRNLRSMIETMTAKSTEQSSGEKQGYMNFIDMKSMHPPMYAGGRGENH